MHFCTIWKISLWRKKNKRNESEREREANKNIQQYNFVENLFPWYDEQFHNYPLKFFVQHVPKMYRFVFGCKKRKEYWRKLGSRGHPFFGPRPEKSEKSGPEPYSVQTRDRPDLDLVLFSPISSALYVHGHIGTTV